MAAHANLTLETGSDGIAVIRIDRPARLNALNTATIVELAGVVDRLAEDPAVGGVIVTGAGERAFVAGADIGELAAMEAREAVVISQRGQRVFRAIELSRKPYIAAINGFALGGGCELALACHLRVASPSAHFGFPEVRLGIVPGYGGTVRLPRLIGRGRALRMILEGETVDAEEALRIGLTNEVAEDGDVVEAARRLLQGILRNGPLAIAAAIESIVRGTDLGTDDALALESHLFGLLATTEDMREGMNAFLEKRPAEFRGR